MHRPKNVPVVGHGNGGHAQFLHALAKLLNVARAIEQRIISM
jgi:hypothetical protein